MINKYCRFTKRNKQMSIWAMRKGFAREGGMVSKFMKESPGPGSWGERSKARPLSRGITVCGIGT